MKDLENLIASGDSAFRQCNYPDAIKSYSSIITEIDRYSSFSKFHQEAISVQRKIGWCFWYLGEWLKVENQFGEALSKSLAFNHSGEHAKALMGQGWILLARGVLKAAEEKTIAAKEQVLIDGNQDLIYRHRYLASAITIQKGDLEQAEQINKRTIFDLQKIVSELPISELKLLSASFCHLARIELMQGNFDKSTGYIQRAIDILQDSPPSIEQGEAQMYLGTANSKFGDQLTALKFLRKALKIFISCGSIYHQGMVFDSLGQTFLYLEDLDRALFFFKKSLEIFKKLSIKHKIGSLFGKIGNVYMAKEDYPTAEKYYIRDLLASMRVEIPQNQAYLNRNLGRLFFIRKEDQSSISHYHESITHFQMAKDELGIASTYIELSRIMLDTAQYEEAIKLSEQAMEIFTRVNYQMGKMKTHLLFGRIYRLCNRCSAALQHLKAAESHSQKMGNHSYKAKILLEYGLINKDMGSNESATNFLLRALREARCSQLQDLTSQILEHLAEIDIVCVASEITD